jgi:hypothetical protein
MLPLAVPCFVRLRSNEIEIVPTLYVCEQLQHSTDVLGALARRCVSTAA